MKLNNKGFTLIELLVIIVLLAIIGGISFTVVIGVLDKAREKSYKTTINNIESTAVTYLKEYSDKILFKDISDSSPEEYACIQVKDLIEKGYFDNDILSSEYKKDKNVEAEHSIYITKNKNTQTIEQSIYDTNSLYCNSEYTCPDGYILSEDDKCIYTYSATVKIEYSNCDWKQTSDTWTSSNKYYCRDSETPPKCSNPNEDDKDPTNHIAGYKCRICFDQSYKLEYPNEEVSGRYKYNWDVDEECIKKGYLSGQCSLRIGSGTKIYEYQCTSSKEVYTCPDGGILKDDKCMVIK